MKFWRGNKIDAEYELSVEEVARKFLNSKYSTANPQHDEIIEFLPLERRLRNFMTAPDGLNSTWDNEDDFDQVWDIACSDEHVEAGEREED